MDESVYKKKKPLAALYSIKQFKVVPSSIKKL